MKDQVIKDITRIDEIIIDIEKNGLDPDSLSMVKSMRYSLVKAWVGTGVLDFDYLNYQDRIRLAKDLKRELEESYASKESIDKIFNDLVDSINRMESLDKIISLEREILILKREFKND